MYIDTDVTMALIGLDDNLLDIIDLSKMKNLKTSVMTIFEIRDILSEMNINKDIKEILDFIKKEDIEILPLDEEVLLKSIELLYKHKNLILFDINHAIHASHCILIKETIYSTDSIYKRIGDIKYKNPKKLENIDNYNSFNLEKSY